MPQVLHLCSVVCSVACVACPCLACESDDDFVEAAAVAERRVESPPIVVEQPRVRAASAIDDPDGVESIEFDESMAEFSESLRDMFALIRCESPLWIDLCASHAAVNIGHGDALTHSLSAAGMASAIAIPAPGSAMVLGMSLLIARNRRRR